jgi:hypothetical protein
MIYLLETNEVMPHWYVGFCELLSKGLGNVHSVETSDSLLNPVFGTLTANDWLFITSYKDLAYPSVISSKAKKVYFHQGSGACPYMDCIDVEQERKDLKNVDLHLFSLPTFERLTKKYYQLENTATIGFPLDLSKYEKYRAVPKKKKIVVSGHITPGKQFYLATYLLKDLMPEYEVWFSVIEHVGGATGTWTEFYHLSQFEEMGFKFRIIKDKPSAETTPKGQEEFYEFLSDASHIFTCSLADTIALPIVEGALCGATPIAPAIRNYWPQFMDYVSYGYEPFSQEDIIDIIKNVDIKFYNPPKIDTKWFDSKLVIERLLEVLV